MEPTRILHVINREQNLTNLFEAGLRGTPLLLLDGDADRFILGDEVYNLVKGKLKDVTRHTTKNGSHVFFYEEETEFVGNLVKFGNHVF